MMERSIGIWDFSAKFAVYEPGPNDPKELFDKHESRPTLAEWRVPSVVETFEVRGKRAPPGDFPGTTGFMHLLSPRVIATMGDVFDRYGSLYRVRIEGQADGWFLFDPGLVVDCLDLHRSKVMRNVSRPVEINSVLEPVFKVDQLPPQGLFTVPECRHGDIYVCEDIKALVKKHRLKGLVLKANRFGKPWIS